MSKTQLDRLFVLGLDYAIDDYELAEFFNATAPVTRASVVIDKATGRSRGFGFVSFVTAADATTALETLNGVDLRGRRLTVRFAEDNRPARGTVSNTPIRRREP